MASLFDQDFLYITTFFVHFFLGVTLGWPISKVGYIHQNRSIKKKLIDSVADHIRGNEKTRAWFDKWNYADNMLYKHYNESFWRKIEEIPTKVFDEKMSELRALQSKIAKECPIDDTVEESKKKFISIAFFFNFSGSKSNFSFIFALNLTTLNFLSDIKFFHGSSWLFA